VLPSKFVQVRAAAVVFGMDRDGVPLAVAVIVVIPPSGRRAQIQPPAAGPGDQAVDLHGHAVDRGQGSPDVKMMAGTVGPPRRVEHA